MTREQIMLEIGAERDRQTELSHGGDTEAFDKTNTPNDWIAYICAYLGRASRKVFRNEREGHEFRNNLVKVAALCVAALEWLDHREEFGNGDTASMDNVEHRDARPTGPAGFPRTPCGEDTADGARADAARDAGG